MTLEQALEELRVLWANHEGILGLVPDNLSASVVWDVVDIMAYKNLELHEDYSDCVIGSGPTPIAAIQAAKEKLAE